MALKGSKTEQNLKDAFAGESQANRRYLYFAAKADVEGSEVTADVGLGPVGEGAYGISVALRISLPAVDRAQAEELVKLADKVCPYSNATRGNVSLTHEIV